MSSCRDALRACSDGLRTFATAVGRKLGTWATESQPGLVTKFVAELTGCMVFHFVGSAAPTAAVNSVSLMVLVYYAAKLSGAHLNPAVTLTFAMLGYTNPVEVVVYWAAQVGGATLGALWLAVLVPGLGIGSAPTAADAAYSGCFAPGSAISPARLLGWEALCTFCFILPIFSVVWYTQNKSGYGNTGPIIVGLSLFAAASAASPWSGAALNPARVLGSAIVFGCASARALAPYYIVGELIGSAIVPIVIVPYYGISSRLASSADATLEHPSASASHYTDVAAVAPGYHCVNVNVAVPRLSLALTKANSGDTSVTNTTTDLYSELYSMRDHDTASPHRLAPPPRGVSGYHNRMQSAQHRLSWSRDAPPPGPAAAAAAACAGAGAGAGPVVSCVDVVVPSP